MTEILILDVSSNLWRELVIEAKARHQVGVGTRICAISEPAHIHTDLGIDYGQSNLALGTRSGIERQIRDSSAIRGL